MVTYQQSYKLKLPLAYKKGGADPPHPHHSTPVKFFKLKGRVGQCRYIDPPSNNYYPQLYFCHKLHTSLMQLQCVLLLQRSDTFKFPRLKKNECNQNVCRAHPLLGILNFLYFLPHYSCWKLCTYEKIHMRASSYSEFVSSATTFQCHFCNLHFKNIATYQDLSSKILKPANCLRAPPTTHNIVLKQLLRASLNLYI